MPSRFLSTVICAFWLATVGWWFYQEVGVALWFDEPPPFTIDLTDEFRPAFGSIDWDLYQDNRPVGDPVGQAQKPIGNASTEVRYRVQGDLFDFQSRLDNIELPVFGLATALLRLTSTYRVTREGELRWVHADIDTSLSLGALAQPAYVKAELEGPVRDGHFLPMLRLRQPVQKTIGLPPVELSARGSVLNPLHPINRVGGLRPGQRWRMPLIDPVGQAVAGAVAEVLPPAGQASGEAQSVDVAVAREPRPLFWDDQEVLCLFIHYQNDKITACTWVRQGDGLVLQQEVFSHVQNHRLILRRRPQPRLPQAPAW